MASPKAAKACKTVDAQIVKEVLQELKDNELITDYTEHEKKILTVLQKTAKTEKKLIKELPEGMIDNKTMQEVEKKMSAVINQKGIELIKKSFEIETYEMKVVAKRDGQDAIQVHRGGAEFHDDIILKKLDDIKTATVLQWKSVVIELFLFVLRCAGFERNLNEAELKVLLSGLEVIVQNPAFQRALKRFLHNWNKAEGSLLGKAKAILRFLEDIHTLGFFWDIIKLIVPDRSTEVYLKTIEEVVLMIIAAFPFAWVARIALALNSAGKLAEKIVIITTILEIQQTME